MGVTPDALLAVLLSLPPWHQDAGMSADERALMLAPVASSISSVARDRTEAAALVALGFHESRFARYVIDGRCSDGPAGARCDNGRARSPWQVWAVACPTAHAVAEDDPAALPAAAQCTVRLLRGARSRCRGRHPGGDWAGAFSGFRGASCTWEPARKRAASMGAALLAIESEEGTR